MAGLEEIAKLQESVKLEQDKLRQSSRLGLTERTQTWKQFKDTTIEPVEWLVDHMIPRGGLVAISGKPGSYKTFFTLWMAQRIAAGKLLFDHVLGEPYFKDSKPCKPTKVLYFEEEMSARQIHGRIVDMKHASDDGVILAMNLGIKLNNPNHLVELRDFCIKENIGCVMLDPFSTVSGSEDENDNSEATQIMIGIYKELILKNITVIILHHPSKSSTEEYSLRGASALSSKCDEHFVLEKDKREKNLVRVRLAKNRDIDETLVSDFAMRYYVDQADPLKHHIWAYEGRINNDEPIEKDSVIKQITEKILIDDRSSLPIETIKKRLEERSKNHKLEGVLDELVSEGSVALTPLGYKKI